ncbi:unnamed protein product [Dibothriocephalus latus]|uniref:Uncharacterized protein n=1 Tax=Dibothriocephalus latus TaxID=60516 RepID=A0A3P7LX01_DIBLA|nr:unnamed protein product [Dibothriocephalus latus]
MLISFGKIDSPAGDQELCQEFLLRTFFEQVAKGNEDHENIFREPLKIATDFLLRIAYEANASFGDYNKLWRHSGQPLLQACIRSHLMHDYNYLVYDNNYAESTRRHGSRDNAVSVETLSTWRVFFENKTSEQSLSANTFTDNDSVQRTNEELPIDHDSGKRPSPLQQMLEDSLLSYNTFGSLRVS